MSSVYLLGGSWDKSSVFYTEKAKVWVHACLGLTFARLTFLFALFECDCVTLSVVRKVSGGLDAEREQIGKQIFSTGQLALEGVPEGFKLSLSIWSLCETATSSSLEM